MELYNPDDIAVKKIQSFTSLEVSLGLDKKDMIPDGVKAEVVMVGTDVERLKEGEIIWFDPGFQREVKELDLIVLHKNGILLKD